MSTKPMKNHTGTAISPEHTRQMVEGTKEFRPSPGGTGKETMEMRVRYAKEAEPVGTYPPPSNEQQFQQAATQARNAEVMNAFMDKLGARLAFERTGVRLYETLITKHEAYGGFDGGPSAQDLQHICDEEFQHFRLLRDCIEQLGGDPTAVTPAADVQATAGMGIGAVLTDPRTDLVQCLDAILVAELADHASWDHLCAIAELAGEPDMVSQFKSALQKEEEHLRNVQGWLSAASQQMAA